MTRSCSVCGAVKSGAEADVNRQLAFAIPPALSSQVTLVVDEPEANVEFPTAVAFHSVTTGGETRVEGTIGSGERVELLWSPRVKRAAETIYAQREDAIIVLTDVRYDFEVDFIQSLGGRVFYIDRPGVGPANEEEFISFFDIFTAFPEITSDPIYNDGTKEQLGAALQERIECMKI